MLIPSLLEMIAMAQHMSKPSVWPWSAKVWGHWAGSGDGARRVPIPVLFTLLWSRVFVSLEEAGQPSES